MTNIYTDGGFSIDRNIGAYAFAVVQDGKCIFEYSSAYTDSTNNKMEIKAVYESMVYASKHPLRQYEIITDSQYVYKSLLEWMPGWIRNGWLTSLGKPVLNKQIWEMVYPFFQKLRNVRLAWTKGHAKDASEHTYWNNYVDDLCTNAMNGIYVGK